MSQTSIRKLLGYSPKDPMIFTESDADDVVDAYRDLVVMARGDTDFEDLVDGIVNFLDTVADVDPDGQVEKKFVATMKTMVASDEFKDQVKSVLSVVGESRTYDGSRHITESLEEIEAELTKLATGIKMARDFHEVASEVAEFLSKLREMNSGLGGAIETEMVNGMADFMDGLKKVIMSKAKKLGVE